MWYTALILGVAGSLHCVGMCSPLLMAVTNLTPAIATNRLLYNSGRVLTYAILGGVFSGVGLLFPFSRYQNALSIVFGIALVIVAILRIDSIKIPVLVKGTTRLNKWIKLKFGFFLSKKSSMAIFSMGMLNGILPCGMTFMAFSYCLMLNSPIEGFNFMLMFGIGTLPAMIGFAPLILAGVKRLKLSLSHVTTGLLILSGVILVARPFLFTNLDTALNKGDKIDIVVCR